jgi:hypothetical protein
VLLPKELRLERLFSSAMKSIRQTAEASAKKAFADSNKDQKDESSGELRKRDKRADLSEANSQETNASGQHLGDGEHDEKAPVPDVSAGIKVA